MILFRLRLCTVIDGWWDCLECGVFFTKRCSDLFCYDCIKGFTK